MAGKHDPEKLRGKLFAYAKQVAFFDMIDLEVEDFGPGWSRCTIRPGEDLRNSNGAIHGGVIASLIDAGAFEALLMTEEYQTIVREQGGSLSTLDLRVRYLRPLTGDVATCQSKITRLGKRIVHASGVVNNSAGKEIAFGDTIMMFVRAGD
jgi:acyl-CoA thioesterase